ncbi:uncharacterized protein LOC119546321 [Drosophila subpulchrella]|uniref:uncharacterized protein LOC119546321 n=1 Tax=Drosophila subpulchrella TaxID=1486046 RepID=UPI0018A19191|nr:uncharacterized protein LOC119546321 [Drosophila subpulchrella]
MSKQASNSENSGPKYNAIPSSPGSIHSSSPFSLLRCWLPRTRHCHALKNLRSYYRNIGLFRCWLPRTRHCYELHSDRSFYRNKSTKTMEQRCIFSLKRFDIFVFVYEATLTFHLYFTELKIFSNILEDELRN